jgi:hypothetical protein
MRTDQQSGKWSDSSRELVSMILKTRERLAKVETVKDEHEE